MLRRIDTFSAGKEGDQSIHSMSENEKYHCENQTFGQGHRLVRFTGRREDDQPDNDIVESGLPYPGKTNQDIINIFNEVAVSFAVHFWDDWIKPAGLEFMAVPDSNRTKSYSGPRIEDLPVLSDAAKAAILAKIISS